MSNFKTIVLSGMPILNGNRGVCALATATIYLVNMVAKKNGWTIKYLHLGRRKGVDIVNIAGQQVEITNVLFNRFDYLKGFLWHCMHPSYFISEFKLKKADYLLDITGGDSYSDIYGMGRFYHSDFVKKMFRFFHIPQMMLPQTIGPFEDYHVMQCAVKSVETTDIVLTRDKLSHEWVVNNTRQKNVYELIDVAFFMPYTKMIFDKSKIHLGLNVSALLWYGGYTRNNQFGLKCNYQETIYGLLDKLLCIDNVIVHLIPHVVGPDEGGIENDYYVSTRIIQHYNVSNLIVAPYFFTPVEAKNYISGMDFFMGARMHSCIAAFSSGVPVAPMAYSRKFNGLFAETLHYPYMVDMKIDDENVIKDKIVAYFNQRDVLCKAISDNFGLLEERKSLILKQIELFLKNE